MKLATARTRTLVLIGVVAVLVLALGATAALLARRDGAPGDLRDRHCAYTANKVSGLATLGRLTGHRFDCAVVFNDASPDWKSWERPWFVGHPNADLDWSRWVRDGGGDRALVVTQNLFPAAVNKTNWRAAGARGAFTPHAKALARNLVKAGLGHVVIRLGHEANGTWYPDSIGNTPQQFAQWRALWRKTVLAMRSVPGAHFTFDWTISAPVRPIPLKQWYPGDDVVDVVGMDAYDVGVPAGTPRWPAIYTRGGGVRDIVRFARAHGKPLSVPEWGVGPAGAQGAGGDDAAYVKGLASVMAHNRMAYESYFFNAEWAQQLQGGRQSLAAYRRLLAGH
jgi:hypothetical protein